MVAKVSKLAALLVVEISLLAILLRLLPASCGIG